MRALTPGTLVSSVGTTTMVRAFSGTPAEKSRRGKRRGGAQRAASRCTKAMATSLAGSRRSSAARLHPGRCALPLEIDEAQAEQEGGQEADRAQIDGGRMREGKPPYPPQEAGTIGDVGLEVASAPADEVVADVGGAIGRLPDLRRLARALDGTQDNSQLALSGGLGQLLHGLAIAVAALEIHARVGPLPVQTAVAVADELDRHRVDPSVAGELA